MTSDTLPTGGTSGFWPYSRLEAEGINIILGTNADEINQYLQEGDVGYTLCVGEQIYVSPDSERLDPKYLTRRLLRHGEAAAIPPGQFAFLITDKSVRIPNNAIGFIALRSKQTKFRGLVNVSGFHVDPGYEGKLIFSVFNAGPGPVHVARGDKWFHLMLADLSSGNHIPKNSEGFKEIGTDLITPIKGQFNSLQGLSSRIRKIERDHAIGRWALAAIIALLTGIIVRLYSMSPGAGP